MVIYHDTYKYEGCSITNEECGGSNCQYCDIAKDNKIIEEAVKGMK